MQDISENLNLKFKLKSPFTILIDDTKEHYKGDYEITPKDVPQVLSTRNIIMDEDVTVKAVETEQKSVTPSMSSQEVTPNAGKYISKVMVEKVTSAIDSNIAAENIKKDVTILGIMGTYSGDEPVISPVQFAVSFPIKVAIGEIEAHNSFVINNINNLTITKGD